MSPTSTLQSPQFLLCLPDEVLTEVISNIHLSENSKGTFCALSLVSWKLRRLSLPAVFQTFAWGAQTSKKKLQPFEYYEGFFKLVLGSKVICDSIQDLTFEAAKDHFVLQPHAVPPLPLLISWQLVLSNVILILPNLRTIICPLSTSPQVSLSETILSLIQRHPTLELVHILWLLHLPFYKDYDDAVWEPASLTAKIFVANIPPIKQSCITKFFTLESGIRIKNVDFSSWSSPTYDEGGQQRLYSQIMDMINGGTLSLLQQLSIDFIQLKYIFTHSATSLPIDIHALRQLDIHDLSPLSPSDLDLFHHIPVLRWVLGCHAHIVSGHNGITIKHLSLVREDESWNLVNLRVHHSLWDGTMAMAVTGAPWVCEGEEFYIEGVTLLGLARDRVDTDPSYAEVMHSFGGLGDLQLSVTVPDGLFTPRIPSSSTLAQHKTKRLYACIFELCAVPSVSRLCIVTSRGEIVLTDGDTDVHEWKNSKLYEKTFGGVYPYRY